MDDGTLLGGEGWKVVRRRDAPGGRAGEAEEHGGGNGTEKGGCPCSQQWCWMPLWPWRMAPETCTAQLWTGGRWAAKMSSSPDVDERGVGTLRC